MIKNYSVTLEDLGAHEDERLKAAWERGETLLEYVASSVETFVASTSTPGVVL